MNTDFTRTEAALAKYDAEVAAAWAKVNAMSNEELTDGHVYKAVHTENRLGREVGRAFGLDTADRNNVETCEGCVRPGPWLRNIVATWREEQNHG